MGAREAVHFSRPPPQVKFRSKFAVNHVVQNDSVWGQARNLEILQIGWGKIIKRISNFKPDPSPPTNRFQKHHGGAIYWPPFF